MTTYLPLALASIALCVASVTVVLLFAWRDRHPDVAELKQRSDSHDFEISELTDRLNHWIRRESTRKAREAKEEKQRELVEAAQGEAMAGHASSKAELYKRAAAVRAAQTRR